MSPDRTTIPLAKLVRRLKSGTITRSDYLLIEPFLSRPLTLGLRPGATAQHPSAAPAATRTSSLERALIEGAV